MSKNDSALFYTCSLIEFIGRKCRQKRSAVVNFLGENTIDRIYRNADMLQCASILFRTIGRLEQYMNV